MSHTVPPLGQIFCGNDELLDQLLHAQLLVPTPFWGSRDHTHLLMCASTSVACACLRVVSLCCWAGLRAGPGVGPCKSNNGTIQHTQLRAQYSNACDSGAHVRTNAEGPSDRTCACIQHPLWQERLGHAFSRTRPKNGSSNTFVNSPDRFFQAITTLLPSVRSMDVLDGFLSQIPCGLKPFEPNGSHIAMVQMCSAGKGQFPVALCTVCALCDSTTRHSPPFMASCCCPFRYLGEKG